MISIRRAKSARQRGGTLGSKIPGPPPGGLPVGSQQMGEPPVGGYAQGGYSQGRYRPTPSGSYSRPLRRDMPRSGSGLSLVSFFFWTTFLVSAAIAYLWTFNQTDVVALQLLESQARIEKVENLNRDLQAAIDQLSQIDRISRIARDELGMVIPAAESLFVYLPEMNR